MASFFKKIAKVIHPASRLFLKDKKKKPMGEPQETPEQVQAKWEEEMKNYSNIDTETAAGAKERAQRAGTYSPTTAFQEQMGAESGAASRQLKGASQFRQEALKKRYREMTNKELGAPPAAPPGTV